MSPTSAAASAAMGPAAAGGAPTAERAGAPAADPLADAEPPSGRGQAEPRGRAGGSAAHISARGSAGGSAPITVRPLQADRATDLHARIAEILRATGVFTADEVSVALDLLDEAGRVEGRRRKAEQLPSAGASAFLLPPSPDYLFLGAFTADGELVGYACYGPTPGADRVYDLYWIAVDPALHGAGIGTRLLDEVERRLVASHARLLIVETSSRSDYAATRAFYERRGYGASARVREFYAPGEDRIIYAKRFQLHSPDGAGATAR